MPWLTTEAALLQVLLPTLQTLRLGQECSPFRSPFGKLGSFWCVCHLNDHCNPSSHHTPHLASLTQLPPTVCTYLCVQGPLMAAFFGLTMGFTLHVLASVAAVYDSHSYQEAARQSLGVGAERVAETSMYLYLFGSCIGTSIRWLAVHKQP